MQGLLKLVSVGYTHSAGQVCLLGLNLSDGGFMSQVILENSVISQARFLTRCQSIPVILDANLR